MLGRRGLLLLIIIINYNKSALLTDTAPSITMTERDVRRKVLDSVDTRQLFDETETAIIEWNIDQIVKEARRGKYKRFTVDKAPLRTKYFFGEGYTYGGQLQERGAGNEKLYPRGEVDPIPHWIQDLVIQPLEEAGVVRSGWINSAVVNDYLPGGCIVSHIDPPQLFSRPIITVSFFSDSYLSFGCKVSEKSHHHQVTPLTALSLPSSSPSSQSA